MISTELEVMDLILLTVKNFRRIFFEAILGDDVIHNIIQLFVVKCPCVLYQYMVRQLRQWGG